MEDLDIIEDYEGEGKKRTISRPPRLFHDKKGYFFLKKKKKIYIRDENYIKNKNIVNVVINNLVRKRTTKRRQKKNIIMQKLENYAKTAKSIVADGNVSEAEKISLFKKTVELNGINKILEMEKADNQAAKKKVNELREQIKKGGDNTEEIKTIKTDLEKKENELKEKGEKIKELEKDLNEAVMNNELRDYNVEDDKKLEELEKMKTIQKRENDQLKEDVKQLKEELSTKTSVKNIEKIQEKLNKKEQELAENKMKLDATTISLQELALQVAKLKTGKNKSDNPKINNAVEIIKSNIITKGETQKSKNQESLDDYIKRFYNIKSPNKNIEIRFSVLLQKAVESGNIDPDEIINYSENFEKANSKSDKKKIMMHFMEKLEKEYPTKITKLATPIKISSTSTTTSTTQKDEEEPPNDDEEDAPNEEVASNGLKDDGKYGLYSSQINDIMNEFGANQKTGYFGTFAADQIGTELYNKISGKEKEVSFIMNLDDSNEKGSHWVACFISLPDAEIGYYDPLADPCSESFQKQIKKVVNKLHPEEYLKLKENSVINQKSSSLCGWHSIHFILKRMEGHAYKNASKFSNVRSEEKKIRNFAKKIMEDKYI